MSYTEKEMKVFNLIAEISMDGSVASMPDIVRSCAIGAKVARGVIASLVKKNRVSVDDYEANGDPMRFDYWPTRRDGCGGGCFWGDELTDEEYEA